MLLLGALSARGSRASFVYAGLFALVYGLRLTMNTATFGILSDRPSWLAYVRSALEYLVPIPAALLFQSFARHSRRFLHRFTVGSLIACAAVVIPYEIATQTPYAGKPVIDVLILVLLAVFALDLLATGGESDWRLVRIGAIVFVAFVANEHTRLVQDPYGITREPTGFLFLMVTIVFSTIHRGARAQHRLVGVDSELAAARTIQQSTLPEASPKLPGFEIATIYTPASDVAGDFYDFLPVDEHRLGILIADVSGHGVPAALIASMVKVAIAAQLGHASDPAKVLTGMNEILCGKMQGQFVTAAYLFLDLETSQMRYAAAGHPPLLWWRDQSNQVESVEQNGLMLGEAVVARVDHHQAVPALRHRVAYVDQRLPVEVVGTSRV